MTTDANPEISVCIPVYNGEAYIGTAIDSILSQSFTNFEIVITDDQSKDRTREILLAYCAKDSRVKVFPNEENLGAVRNLNRALSLSKGKYIKPFASDDLMMEGHLEQMHQGFQQDPSITIVACAKEIIDENGAKQSVRRAYPSSGFYEGREVRKDCLRNKASSHIINLLGEPCCVLLRADQVEDGFDTNYFHIADLDMWTRVLSKGNLYYISEPRCQWRHHKNSTTSNNFKSLYYALDFLRIIDKNLDLCIELYGSREQAYLSVAEHLGRFLGTLVREQQSSASVISENLRDWADPLALQSGMGKVATERPITLNNQEYFRQLALFALLKVDETTTRLDSTYAELSGQIESYKRELNTLHSSFSWRSTKIVRKLGSLIKQQN